MAKVQQRINIGYGLSQALPQIFPAPIVAKRAPTSGDFAPIGQIWVNTLTQTAYILCAIIANAAVWNSSAAAAGVFTTLSVTAGPVSLPGPVFIQTGAGAPAGALALHIGDLYINTTAASAVTRMYIATAVGAWTNFTTAA